MLVTRYSTDSLPGTDRFTWWHDMTVSTLISTVLHSAHTVDFHATADILDLGCAQITAMTYPPLTSKRTPRLIRQNDPEYYQLSLTVHGDMSLSQSRREATFGDGDLVLYDSSRPFDGWTGSACGKVTQIVAQFPKRRLPLPPRLVDRLIATPMPRDGGFTGLLSTFLAQVTAAPHQYGPRDTGHLSTVLFDLIAATVAHHLDDPHTVALESRQHALALRVRAFIQHHLGDTDLTVERVAGAHHLSLRSLYRLFEQQGTTPAAYIRHQRLEAARRDLADPGLAARPISAVAACWGFVRPTDFSRAFRTTYGTPPGHYRRTALRDTTGTQNEEPGRQR